MKRMLFNATQAEELRVAIVDGQKLIDLDIESATKEQRKSNIYKAIITRIEPSLEAAFVDYGAERHGFLPFKEVSRSYFKPGIDAGKARIQDALHTGQELIVQVEKDERGNKGAALTTYISLAGRHLVLMPNNPRGGGVSRRIEGDERQELREVMDQLEVPAGMSLIARTAGIGRTVEELQWDMNYLLQLWRAIDSAAQSQSGAFLIYLESSLVIRAIRDYFHAEIGEILIDTDDIFEQAQHFMATVMPANVSRIKRYRDDVPLFSRFQIEHQIESAYSRQVTLPSGGAIVIDHTEALVSVDVNSGRATKGSDIEETAFRTNCEAADEIARQLRLRDLGGLIVIDFIDMESSKNQREVENRLRDALHYDRARVQTGKISRFGLLELSRQRLRPALAETSYITCPRCTGTGHIRSTESAALHILRIIEEEAMKENTGAVHCQVPVDVGTFLLNEKRVDIARIEVRHRVNLVIVPNRHLETPQHEIVRLRHDQLNEEGVTLASYQMAEKAEKAVEEAAYQPPSAQNETKPQKIEAAVRGVTPDQPAPVVEARPVEAKAQPREQSGLFSRIMSFFTGSKKEEEPAATTKPERNSARRDRNDRNERGSRDRGGRGRGGRDGNDRKDRPEQSRQASKRDEPQADSAQKDSSRRQRGDRQEPRERQEPTRREGREDRPPRPPRNEPAPVLTTAPEQPATEGAQNDGDGRRRGRRGGRGRGEKRNGENSGAATSDAVSSTPAAEVAAAPVSSPQQPPATAIAATQPAPRPMPWPTPVAMPAATATPEPAPMQELAPIAAPVPISGLEPIAPTTALSIPEPTPLMVVNPAPFPATVSTPPLAPAAEPRVAPAIPVAPPVKAPVVDIAASLQQAGLQMVETAATVAPPPPPAEPAHPLGRKPKPLVVASEEPLQMVETKNG